MSFWYFYGLTGLGLAVWFLCTFGPKIPADWHYYGWKRALGMTLLILLASPVLPLITVGILIYLAGFYLFQITKERLKK